MSSCMCMGPQGQDLYCPCVMKQLRHEREQDGLTVTVDAGPALEALAELRRKINTPELENFTEGVTLEALHQRERWGSTHDAGKTPADWFWLIGYLAQKALYAELAGDRDKALHHCISTAAALANWHAAIRGDDNSLRPGIAPSEV